MDLCNPLPQPPKPKTCAELDADSCQHQQGCIAISGKAYDSSMQCWRGEKNVGCIDITQGCPAAISFARDPRGQEWMITHGCIPASFTLGVPGPLPQQSWPSCAL